MSLRRRFRYLCISTAREDAKPTSLKVSTPHDSDIGGGSRSSKRVTSRQATQYKKTILIRAQGRVKVYKSIKDEDKVRTGPVWCKEYRGGSQPYVTRIEKSTTEVCTGL